MTDYPKNPRVWSPDELDQAIVALADYITDGLARRQWKRGDLAMATIEIREAFRRLVESNKISYRLDVLERVVRHLSDQIKELQNAPRSDTWTGSKHL